MNFSYSEIIILKTILWIKQTKRIVMFKMK